MQQKGGGQGLVGILLRTLTNISLDILVSHGLDITHHLHQAVRVYFALFTSPSPCIHNSIMPFNTLLHSYLDFFYLIVANVRNHGPPQWYDIVHDFVLGFPKGSHTDRDVFLTYKPMIISLISHCGTPSQQSSPRTKYTIELLRRPMEPSNNLPLIEAQLLLWSPRTKYTLCSTLESLLTTPSKLTISLFNI